MSSFRRGILILGWALLATGCGDSRDKAGPLDPGTSEPATADTVHFADRGLEAVVLVALGNPRGSLTTEQLLTLTQLDARQRGIADLSGIEQLQGLATLDLADNRVSDLAPLAALAGLRVLRLGNNQIAELAPLSGLRRLRQLDLEGNRIVDSSPLAGLDSLQTLILDFNQVVDPSPLLGLSALQGLSLRGNPLEPAALATLVHLLRARGAWIDTAITAPPEVRVPTNSERLALAVWDGSLYLAAPDSSDPFLLLRHPEGMRIAEPAWSPDGTRMAIAVWDEYGACDLVVINGEEGRVTRLTADLGLELSPAWSPDSQHLAFVSTRDGNAEIYTIPAEGGGWSRLTDDPADDLAPDWSPDGEQIAFTSQRAGDAELYLMRCDGTGVHRLTAATMAGGVSEPVWSSSGLLLAFVRGGNNLCVTQPTGVGEVMVTTSWGAITNPCWSPSGALAFLSGMSPCVVSVSSRPDSKQEPRLVRPVGLPCTGLAWSPAGIYGFDREVVLPEAPLTFVDRNLEQVIREALGGDGPITRTTAAQVTELSARSRGIVNLNGLQYLKRLERLDLDNPVTYLPTADGGEEPDTASMSGSLNRVSDLSPLAGLLNLTELSFVYNPVADLSPLMGLSVLSRLRIEVCPIRDVSPLGRNRRLVSLVLRHLQVSDLSALSRLALLQEVRINWTLVEDVTPLSSQRHLVRLDLAHNRIADISPLANATQTEIWLTGNPLNENSLNVVVPALRARGVTVHLE